MLGHLIYILTAVSIGLSIPEFYFDPDAVQFIFFIGVIGIWRYSWAIQHFLRALIFNYWRYPKLRKAALELGDEAKPNHVFYVVTSFRINTETSVDVYKSVVRETINCGVPATIIASIVEKSDERLIKQIFYNLQPPQGVCLKLIRIPGTGKRDALAVGFRAVSSTEVNLNDAVVVVVDGDSILSSGCTKTCYKYFKVNPKLGALTTNEICTLPGNDFITNIYRRWYNVRFAQRHVFMSSYALSNKVLTLTGRMSIFRGNIVGDPKFIHRVEFDFIDHWRLGRFRFLTGDDKSTWYQVLKDGWDMLYIPDATILTIEEIPSRNFFAGANMLMRRWFGNMLRTNSRARKLPLKVTGIYTRWCLYDQLISMWTSVLSFFIAIFGTLKFGGSILLVFILWIMFTRYLMALMLFVLNKKISISWPFFIYFNQFYGSLIKIYMLHNLHKQRWTRQKTSLKETKGNYEKIITEYGSILSLLTYMIAFIILVAFFSGILNTNDIQSFLSWVTWVT